MTASVANAKLHVCSSCGVGIQYRGRRDLIEELQRIGLELRNAMARSSSTLFDVSVFIQQRVDVVRAHADQQCLPCWRKVHGEP